MHLQPLWVKAPCCEVSMAGSRSPSGRRRWRPISPVRCRAECGLLWRGCQNPGQDNAWEPRCDDAGPVRDAIGAAVIDSGVGVLGILRVLTTTSDGVSRMGTSGSGGNVDRA